MAVNAFVRAAAAFALVVAACNGSDSATTNVPAPAVTTSTPGTAPIPPGPGRLAVIDGGGDVVTMRSDGTDRLALTNDGGAVGHWQPLWSPVGDRLVWADTTASGSTLVVRDGDEVVSIPMSAMPFFSMWSPDGTRIGVLHNAARGGLELEIVDVFQGGSNVVGTGAPLYFSWGPDGTQIVSHVGAETLSIFGADGVTALGSTGGDFQTPSWTPAGIVHVVDGALVLQDRDGNLRPIAVVSGPTTMVVGPDGERIAVQVFGPDEPGVFASHASVPEIPPNAVVVLDPETGDFEVASGRTSLGYFWSPDGASLLILMPAVREGELEWWVWQEGEIITRVAFIPTASLVRDLVPFFDQYAQAWRPWAPDSSGFAFVGTIDGSTGVWVHDLGLTEPRFLSEGDWVAWSAR